MGAVFVNPVFVAGRQARDYPMEMPASVSLVGTHDTVRTRNGGAPVLVGSTVTFYLKHRLYLGREDRERERPARANLTLRRC